ncbi:MAG: hypothetical protein J5938_04810, partial [Clostridia bacterium]|nr:hypothetical protein [Clostridia bacterium]
EEPSEPDENGEEDDEDDEDAPKPIHEDEEETSRTTVDNDRIVKVTYEGGTYFILNYNNFTVRVEGKEIGPYGFVRVN